MSARRGNGGLRKKGSVWYAHYRAGDQRIFESTGTGDERDARSFLAQRRRELAEGTWIAPTERAGRARVEAARAELERALAACPEASPLTVSSYLDEWTAKRAGSGVRNAALEAQLMRWYVTPTLGEVSLATLTRLQIKDLVAALTRTTSTKTRKPLSPRTVLHIYRTFATACADAVLDGVLTASPCTLRTRKGELPKKRDKDPTWRARSVYALDEAERLLRFPELADDRRAIYGLMLLAGLRASEAAGVRWSALDVDVTPLARLTVATQADGADVERETKTGEIRYVPVVPALASILDEWRRVGFPRLFLRHPKPDDPIVPTRGDMSGRSFRNAPAMHERLVEDLARAKLRSVPAPQHAMRATFLTLLEAAGANMAIARRATHAAPVDVVGGYIRTSWADLCREIERLPVRLDRELATVTTLAPVRDASVPSAVPVKPRRAKTSAKGMGPAGFEGTHDPAPRGLSRSSVPVEPSERGPGNTTSSVGQVHAVPQGTDRRARRRSDASSFDLGTFGGAVGVSSDITIDGEPLVGAKAARALPAVRRVSRTKR